MKIIRNEPWEHALWLARNDRYLVQQVKDLGKYVQASSWVYGGLIKDTRLQTQHKYCITL